MGEYPDSSAPATRVRYHVLTLLTVMAVLLYLDRVCIMATAKTMGTDLGLSEGEVSRILGSFFFAYALCQVPAGWLGDRLGARVMLPACVLVWSGATALTGLAGGFWALLTARLLLGVSQAGAYPVAARINSLWMPFHHRAVASSAITLGGRAGGALAPVLTAALMLAFRDNWRPVYLLYALLGLAWAAWFWVAFRATPARHPACNAAEVNLIETSRPAEATSPHGEARGIPWQAAVSSLGLWMQCATQFISNIPWAFLVTMLSSYLQEAHELSKERANALASLPLAAGAAGCLVGGVACDRLTRLLGMKWGRNSLGMGTKFVAAAAMLAAVYIPDPLWATVVLALSAFIFDAGLPATWAYFQDAGGPYVGTLLGWANMFGNFGAALSPVLLVELKKGLDSWTPALVIFAGLYVLAGLCWLGIDPRTPIVPPEKT